MCGIAGLCNFRGNWKENIKRMNAHMKNRGPNATGIWCSEDASVVLGHQRLSIMDLSENGAQPMTSHSGRYTIVYNGEIYNSAPLAEKLLADAAVDVMRGSSDTEILLEAIEAYGLEKTICYCKGMFAIALYDHQSGQLSLVRDRIGEKPLYYGFVNGAFAFASDIGCFREIDGFCNPINRDVLGLYFTHGYIPAPYSIYQDIYKLEPGVILTINKPYAYFNPLQNGMIKAFYDAKVPQGLQKVTLQDLTRIEKAAQETDSAQRSGEPVQYTTYWSMKETAAYGQNHIFAGSQKEAADELERLMREAIRGQMVADVPVGAFLSAGLDSTTVVSLMQELDPGKVRTFTIGMDDPKYNEAEAAREIAKYLGTEHTDIYISGEDAKGVIPALSGMFGEPFADSSQIPTYLVSKMTREHVTVSLSGDAGDELFCGYRSYESVSRIWDKIGQFPYFLRRPAGEVIAHSPLARKEVWRDKAKLLAATGPADLYRRQYELEPFLSEIVLHQNGAGLQNTKEITALPYSYNTMPQNYLQEVNHAIMLMDMTMYHPDDILVKVDRTAMAVSLETRVPLLDRDIVEFAWTLPVQYLRDGKTGKKVLRDVLYRHVPREMMERPKKGFSIPIAKWLREPGLREWAEDLLAGETIIRQGILNPDTVAAIWNDFVQNGKWRVQIWYLLMFQQWMQENEKGAVHAAD